MTTGPTRLINLETSASLPVEASEGIHRVHGVAGIGHPARFFDSLRQCGFDVIEHAFPDHHRFESKDVMFNDDLPVIMTEKDAVKIVGLSPWLIHSAFFYLEIEGRFDSGFGEQILAQTLANYQSRQQH